MEYKGLFYEDYERDCENYIRITAVNGDIFLINKKMEIPVEEVIDLILNQYDG